MDCRAEYENRLQARRRTHEQLRRKDGLASGLRAATFVLAGLVAWWLWGREGAPWWSLLMPVAPFLAAVVYHGSVRRRLQAASRAIQHYERCLDRLDSKWSGVGPNGDEFADPLHPYSGDLDLFGEGSLFQLLNSPVTPGGQRALARWLTPDSAEGLPTREEILDRQIAVCGLSDQLDIRERLAVIGPTTQSQQDAAQLSRWLDNPGGLTAPWVRVAGFLLGVLGTGALVGSLTVVPVVWLLLVVFVQLVFVFGFRATLNDLNQCSEQAVFELRRVVRVLSVLETVRGDDPAIGRLRQGLTGGGTPASRRIDRLRRLVSQFENLRRNPFMAPLALITMGGFYFACEIDRWRTEHGPHVGRWFEAAGELEALLAFSQLHFENPACCLPTVEEGEPRFVASAISHPLLPPPAAVANDVPLGPDCRLLIVSGSNMSGKSTLMRSVGLNAVLAWAGAPVFAKELTLSRLHVAAAMRVQDSLQTGTSHFLAELKRIQLVVELAEKKAENSEAILFLLDEILHGTNSHDRLVGARGVIRRLLASSSLGLVTTHDLALSEMATELDSPAHNVHFRDESVGGEMTFDYRMRDGVVPKSNALTLMRLLGLEV